MSNHLFLVLILLVLTCACQNEEDKSWQLALQKNSNAAIDSFLLDYPDSKYSMDASIQKETFAWFSAKANNTVYGYKKYLVNYPDGKFSKEVPSRLDAIKTDNISLKELTASTFIGKINYGNHETQVLAFKFANINKDSSGISFLAKINTSEIRKDIEGRINPKNFSITFMEDPKDKTMLNITDGRAYMKENKIMLESTNVNQYWNLIKYNE